MGFNLGYRQAIEALLYATNKYTHPYDVDRLL